MRRRTTSAAFVALAVAATTALSACASTTPGITVEHADQLDPNVSDPPSSTTSPTTGEDPFGWANCPDDPDLDCGWLIVPKDEADPGAGTFRLYVVRRPASDPSRRIGSLLVNPGGPGFGGSVLAEQADFIYSRDLLDRFDIIGWDPRGTGRSEPAVDCVDNLDPYFGVNVPPVDEAGRQALIDAAADFGAACLASNAAVLPYVSTEASARDMDRIRQALGEDRISYFGFSYGSELGATWATLFPDTVRAAVLDGAVDPNADALQSGLDQARGFERQLTEFLRQCSANRNCRFHNDGDAEGAFDALMDRLVRDPIVVESDRTPVNGAVAFTAVANAMYASFLWGQLERALADAQAGDGARLLSMFDDYYQRMPDGSWGNEIEAFLAIGCLDDPGPTTPEEVDAYIDDFLAVAPRLGPVFAYSYWCTMWPVEPAGKVTITGVGAGPILVVGVTGDAATPIESTRAMAETLEDGRLVVLEADQHGAYGLNDCVNRTVDRYLIDLEAPSDEVRCS
jgi:pimeloyl-ACP methyl ester carboxylesterase